MQESSFPCSPESTISFDYDPWGNVKQCPSPEWITDDHTQYSVDPSPTNYETYSPSIPNPYFHSPSSDFSGYTFDPDEWPSPSQGYCGYCETPNNQYDYQSQQSFAISPSNDSPASKNANSEECHATARHTTFFSPVRTCSKL